MSVLKVLQTNVCRNSCAYCAERASCDVPRATASPDGLARTFAELRRAGLIDGLFLPSAIPRYADAAMERMLATAELVRRKYGFRGYVHLKVLPGAGEAAISRAAELADRLSVNFEAPTEKALAPIAPEKSIRHDLLPQLRLAADEARSGRVRAGVTTQFVVGASDESDLETLRAAAWLYEHLALRRAYYSPFRPVTGTPLEGRPPEDQARAHRLYQADWLLRFYGFSLDELVFEPSGALPREADPKMAWAHAHPEFFPVDPRKATLEELLRVPGIGPKRARAIVEGRRSSRLGLSSLPARARPFLAARRSERQLLFESMRSPRPLVPKPRSSGSEGRRGDTEGASR